MNDDDARQLGAHLGYQHQASAGACVTANIGSLLVDRAPPLVSAKAQEVGLAGDQVELPGASVPARGAQSERFDAARRAHGELMRGQRPEIR